MGLFSSGLIEAAKEENANDLIKYDDLDMGHSMGLVEGKPSLLKNMAGNER